jgi:fatty acid-binding protein DegV
MDRKQSTIRVQCTCCEAILTVDKASGEVVFTDKPKSKKVSFEDALQKVKQDQDSAEDRFKEAFSKEKDRMNVIDKKFEEAMKRKDELEMPIKPIDLD